MPEAPTEDSLTHVHQQTCPPATQDKNATASKEGSGPGLDSLDLTFKMTYQDLLQKTES